jgi:hypothetical protein
MLSVIYGLVHPEGEREAKCRELRLRDHRQDILQVVRTDVIDADLGGCLSRSRMCHTIIDGDGVVPIVNPELHGCRKEVNDCVFPNGNCHVDFFLEISFCQVSVNDTHKIILTF